MKVTVKVTEEMADPLNRLPESFMGVGCMVERALRTVLSPEYDAAACWYSVTIVGRTYVTTQKSIRLPHEVTKRICAYDAGQNLGAFEFEADIPAKFLKERAGK